MLYLSAYFERYPAAYYDHLLQVSQQGAWNDWLIFFARGVAQDAMNAVDRVARLRDLQADYIERVRTARASALLIKLIEHLFDQPAVTSNRVRQLLNVIPRTAQHHIDHLRKAGILTEITGQKRNRIYLAPEILPAIHEPKFTRPTRQPTSE